VYNAVQVSKEVEGASKGHVTEVSSDKPLLPSGDAHRSHFSSSTTCTTAAAAAAVTSSLHAPSIVISGSDVATLARDCDWSGTPRDYVVDSPACRNTSPDISWSHAAGNCSSLSVYLQCCSSDSQRSSDALGHLPTCCVNPLFLFNS